MIESKINLELIFKYDSEFKVGEWIVDHHFQLEMVTGDKRTTKHTYRINFFPSTVLNPIPAKDALAYPLYEVSFRDVVGDHLSRFYLISKSIYHALIVSMYPALYVYFFLLLPPDLIGYVVDIDEIQYSDPNNRRYNAMTGFKLKDAG